MITDHLSEHDTTVGALATGETRLTHGPRAVVINDESDGGATWTYWQDDQPITTDGIPDSSAHSIEGAYRSIAGLLGI